MARKKQKLINFHSSGNTEVPLNELNYGEIAVRHRENSGESQLIIKTSDNTRAVFVESAGVINMISLGVQGVTTNVVELAESLSAVSTTTVNTASALAEHIITTGLFYDEIRNNLSASVISDINNLAQNYYTKSEIDTTTGNLTTSLINVSSAVSAVSASVISVEESLVDRIESALTVVYKFKGTVNSIDDLLNITNASNGDVYNLTVASGITPPGTNYAWVEDADPTKSHWDALGGTIDLSGYATSSALNEVDDRITGVHRQVTALTEGFSALGETVHNNYTTHSEASGMRDTAITSARTYTDSVSGYIATTLENKYWTSAVTQGKIDEINTTTSNLTTGLTNVSNAVSAFSASVYNNVVPKVNSALQGFALTGSDAVTSGTETIQSGAIADYTSGGMATLDLTTLIIDCGEW